VTYAVSYAKTPLPLPSSRWLKPRATIPQPKRHHQRQRPETKVGTLQKQGLKQGIHTFLPLSMRRFFNKKGEYQINETGYDGKGAG
jgi:hypothetical protein